MKKVILIILALICLFIISFPVSVNADNNEVLLILQAKVDEKIGSNGREVMATIFEKTTYKEYEILLYPENNYKTKVNVVEGTYKIGAIYISGTIEDFNFENLTFDAKGQTINVVFNIGNANWDGKNNGVPNGTLDREKTDELLIEDGKKAVDWEKIDNKSDEIHNEVANNDTVSEKPEVGEPEIKSDTEVSEINTQEKATEKRNNGKLIFTIIFILFVLGGTFGFLIYKRFKAGIPFADNIE